MRKEKAPIYKLSRSKALKTQQVCHYRHTTKTSRLFLLYSTGVNFSPRNNFANLGSFAKVSAQFTTPCLFVLYQSRLFLTANSRTLGNYLRETDDQEYYAL